MQIVKNNKLVLPLYHGTSTLFLDSILEHGLNSKNPIAEWGILEAGKEINRLGELHLGDWMPYQTTSGAFSLMLEQKIGPMNWQHGQTYCSPSSPTAVRYALSNCYGSELITYALRILQELINREVKEADRDLRGQYPKLFELLEINPGPLLIKVSNVRVNALAPESNIPLEKLLGKLDSYWSNNRTSFEALTQQFNLRLNQPIPNDDLEISLITVQKWDPYFSEYELHPILSNNVSP